MPLGPLDLRTRRSRCMACARRRIKCEGGLPCTYCGRMNAICVPQINETKNAAVFVYSTPPGEGNKRSLIKAPMPVTPLPVSLSLNMHIEYISYFFSTFTTANSFTGIGSGDLGQLALTFQTSIALYNAVLAVAGLHAHGQRCSRRHGKMESPKSMALSAYSTSVQSFRAEFRSSDPVSNDAFLQTTLVLGLFELMYDDSGEGWVKHFLYGTPALLQLRGPRAHISGFGRSFFLTVRVLEICRALLYSEETFLSEKGWVALMEDMWLGDLRNDWHPKEALYNLMISCSSLSIRVLRFVLETQKSGFPPLQEKIYELAQEGLSLQTAFYQWYSETAIWNFTSSPTPSYPQSKTDSQLTLALIYYNAILIYLSGTYDYHIHWDTLDAPILAMSVVEYHVKAIIEITRSALERTNLAGILFLVPLRIAGARAQSVEARAEIIGMFEGIVRRGFVVGNAFSDDLRSLWEKQERR